MQAVVWGNKNREVRVPVGWQFLKHGTLVKENDMFFNPTIHAFVYVPSEFVGSKRASINRPTGDDLIVIRRQKKADPSDVITDNRFTCHSSL